VACITGASSGIGQEFACQLAGQGYDLLLIARRQDRLQVLAERLSACHSARVEIFPVDLAVPEELACLETRLAGEDRLEILVNNAGFGTQGNFWDVDLESQDRMVRVHILAPLRLTYAVLPGMLARRKGGVINISSVAAFFALPENVNYSSSKGYLKLFSEALALELVGTGVNVQALCPGFTHTEFHARLNMDTRLINRMPWMETPPVVQASLRALKKGGPVVLIPGWFNRLVVFLAGLIPRFLLRWVARWVRARQRNNAQK
jgi:short-subunit dehydrogenase